MIPKLIRTASFGHAGMHLPATAGVRAIVTLLDPAGTSFASLIYGGCARHTGGGQGQSPPLVRDVRPLLAGLMALPPPGSAAEPGGSGPGRPGTGGEGHLDVRIRRRAAGPVGCLVVGREGAC